MSATDPDRPGGGAPDVDFESSEAHRYFRELEDFFIDLRGAPLQLSPADWQVSKRWYERGIPLSHVKRVLEEVFTRRRERGAEGLVTLRYCRKPVEAQWQEVEEMRATGERAAAPRLDVAARLAALADALPAELAGRGELAARILGLEGDTEHVEGALSASTRSSWRTPRRASTRRRGRRWNARSRRRWPASSAGSSPATSTRRADASTARSCAASSACRCCRCSRRRRSAARRRTARRRTAGRCRLDAPGGLA